MPSLGEQLRAQRERKGITLEQAAADTRIREKFLTALEAGDYPGPEVLDLRSGDDGNFGVTVSLNPGSNHLVVDVLDAAGKTNHVSRTIQYQAPATAIGPAPQLVVDQPAAGATLTNVSVLVSGHVDRSVSRLLINNIAVAVSSEGTFQSRYYMPAGPQSFRVTAQTSSGGTVEETRNVVVVYTAAVVNVFVRGGDTWLLATVDGADVAGSGRVYKDGETAAFIGKEVRIKAGNAAAAQVIYNGQLVAGLGKQGEVVERTFVAQ